MRTLPILLIIIAAALGCQAAPQVHPTVARADSAYLKGSYEEASRLYTEAIDTLGASADLYYNLGNAYYRTGRPGQAILAYERALRINPRHSEARANLQFVDSRIVDRPGARGTLISEAVGSVCSMATADAWAWIAFGLLVATLGAVALYFFARSIPLRKAGFFGGAVLLVATGIAVFVALTAASYATDTEMAVVTRPSTILSNVPATPRTPAQEAMMLHEGSRVEILDSVMSTADSVPGLWLDVRIDNAHRAWLRASDAERI